MPHGERHDDGIVDLRSDTVTRPTPRSRSSPRSRFTPNGSTSVTSYDVPYGVAGTASVVT